MASINKNPAETDGGASENVLVAGDNSEAKPSPHNPQARRKQPGPITRPPGEPADRRTYALAVLRVAYLPAQLAMNEIETAGLALKANECSPEAALAMLSEVGLEYMPDPERRAA